MFWKNIPTEYRGEQIVSIYQTAKGEYYASIQTLTQHPRDKASRGNIGDRHIKSFKNVNMSF